MSDRKESLAVEEHNKAQLRLRTVVLLILAGITTVLVCFITYKTFGLSRDITVLTSNDIPHIEQRIDGLEKGVDSIKTSVVNIQEHIKSLTNNLKSYLQRADTERQDFLQQIRKDGLKERQEFREQIRQDIRKELRALSESKQTVE